MGKTRERQRSLLRFHAELVPVDDHDELVSAAPGPRGQLTVLWSTRHGADLLRGRAADAGGASFPVSRTASPVSVRVSLHGPELVGWAAIADLKLAHAYVQPLPDDQFLIVGARCRWRPGAGPERNAVIYDAAGQRVRAGTLGDGIGRVQVTRAGRVWVSYFDEGILGNFGLGGTGPEPLGAPGIVGYEHDLQPVWRFPAGEITDCYAMSLDEETVWACPYTDFPIVRIHDDRVTQWGNDIRGAHTLVASGSTVALIGGYDNDRDRVAHGTLADGRFRVRRTSRLSMPDGTRIRQATAIEARDYELHVVCGTTWYKASLNDLAN